MTKTEKLQDLYDERDSIQEELGVHVDASKKPGYPMYQVHSRYLVNLRMQIKELDRKIDKLVNYAGTK